MLKEGYPSEMHFKTIFHEIPFVLTSILFVKSFPNFEGSTAGSITPLFSAKLQTTFWDLGVVVGG